MLLTPMDCGCHCDSVPSSWLTIADLVREQPEGLIGADPIERLPVLGNDSVLDAEEVQRRESAGRPVWEMVP